MMSCLLGAKILSISANFHQPVNWLALSRTVNRRKIRTSKGQSNAQRLQSNLSIRFEKIRGSRTDTPESPASSPSM